MDDEYELVGCIDFDTTSYAISVPILQKRNSNYVFIPKTDGHFIVLDFYLVEITGFKIRYLNSDLKRKVRIGCKAPVPIIDGSNTFILNPDTPDENIRAENPLLGEAAVKAFISLRKRIAVVESTGAQNPFKMEIEEPIRSRYWVSKFGALLASVHQNGEPNAKISEAADNIRQEWLTRFSAKATFEMVDRLMNTSYRPLENDQQKNILLERFDILFQMRGLNISRQDLAGYEKAFPTGIIPTLKNLEQGPSYRAWRTDDQYSQIIRAQLTNRWTNAGSREHGDALAIWPKQDLMRIFRIIRLLIADEPYLTSALAPLADVLQTAAEKLIDLEDCIDDLSLLRTNGRSELIRTLKSIFGVAEIDVFEASSNENKFESLIDRVLDYYDKALILSQTASANLRMIDISEVGVDGVNPGVYEAIRFDRRKLAVGETYSVWTSRFQRLMRNLE